MLLTQFWKTRGFHEILFLYGRKQFSPTLEIHIEKDISPLKFLVRTYYLTDRILRDTWKGHKWQNSLAASLLMRIKPA